MLVIVKKSMAFREPVAVKTNKKTGVVSEVKTPWMIFLKASMSPQECPDHLASLPAFQHAVKFGAVVPLGSPKLAA
jgi:hypothetical protein